MNLSAFQFLRWMILPCFFMLTWTDSVHSMLRMKDVRSRIPGLKIKEEYRSVPFHLPWAPPGRERFQERKINRKHLNSWLAFVNTHSNVYEKQKRFIIKELGDLLDYFDLVFNQNSNGAASLEAAQSTTAKTNGKRDVTVSSSLLKEGKYDIILKTFKMISGINVKWVSDVNGDFYFKKDQKFSSDFEKSVKDTCRLLLLQNNYFPKRKEIKSNGLKFVSEFHSVELHYLPLVARKTQDEVLEKVKLFQAPFNKIKPSHVEIAFHLLDHLQEVQILEALFTTLSTKQEPSNEEHEEIYFGFSNLNKAEMKYYAEENAFHIEGKVSKHHTKARDTYEEQRAAETEKIGFLFRSHNLREVLSSNEMILENFYTLLRALKLSKEQPPFEEMDALILSISNQVPDFDKLKQPFSEYEQALSFRIALLEYFWDYLKSNDGEMREAYGDPDTVKLILEHTKHEFEIVFKTSIAYKNQELLRRNSQLNDVVPLFQSWYKIVRSYYVSQMLEQFKSIEILLRIVHHNPE